MADASCIFCKIIKREIPSTLHFESDQVAVISDIHPKAPVHLLILPKKHLVTLMDVTHEDASVVYSMVQAVQEMAQKLTNPQAFNIIVNNGAAAGQSVAHLHWHFLAGRNIYEGGFSL